MDRIKELKNQISPSTQDHGEASKESQQPDSSSSIGFANPMFKAKKYYHLREMGDIKQALADNIHLEAMIPRLRIPEELESQLPENIKTYLSHMRQWNVQRDGPDHNRIRRAFPHEFMQYQLTRKLNYSWIDQIVDNILTVNYQKCKPSGVMEVHHSISAQIAVDMLCYVLGLKNPTPELKAKLIVWADHSADTGGRFDLSDNADKYLAGHQFFRDTIAEIKAALKTGDQSKYDFKGVIAKMIIEEKIVDLTEMANQCQMWVLGGSHNPANLISLSLGILLENWDQYQEMRKRVKENPACIHEMVNRVTNEVLRLRPPAHVIVRFANCPIMTSKVQAQKGEAIILHLEESSRKQPGLENPEQFNMFREGGDHPRHIGFGSGPHRCMGGETGQLCSEILIERLLFDDILRPETLQKRDFRNLKLKQFEWVESGSFKEITAFTVTI